MKQVIYPIFVLLAMINSLANASERQSQSPASTLRRALTSKNLPLINLWETEVLADDSNDNPIERQPKLLSPGDHPNTDLITFGHTCDFFGSDFKNIQNVDDLLTCGARYCSGSGKCTHFAYDTAGKVCYLKTNYGSGSSWAKSRDGFFCGFIPFRACDVNKANVPRLLSCLTLNV